MNWIQEQASWAAEMHAVLLLAIVVEGRVSLARTKRIRTFEALGTVRVATVGSSLIGLLFSVITVYGVLPVSESDVARGWIFALFAASPLIISIVGLGVLLMVDVFAVVDERLDET